MNPTNEQLCALWNSVREHLTHNELIMKCEAIAFAENLTEFPFDMMISVLDVITDDEGMLLGEAVPN